MKIFISYRRSDTQSSARLIYHELCKTFSNARVFFDIHSVPIGADFFEYIKGEVSQCDVLLAVIGPRWLPAPSGQDYVRAEIQAALAGEIPVVPIFVDGADPLSPASVPPWAERLVRINGLRVDSGGNFHTDIENVVKAVEALTASRTRARPHAESSGRVLGAVAVRSRKTVTSLVVIGGAAVLVVTAVLFVAVRGPSSLPVSFDSGALAEIGEFSKKCSLDARTGELRLAVLERGQTQPGQDYAGCCIDFGDLPTGGRDMVSIDVAVGHPENQLELKFENFERGYEVKFIQAGAFLELSKRVRGSISATRLVKDHVTKFCVVVKGRDGGPNEIRLNRLELSR